MSKAYPVYVVDDEEGVRAMLVELCADRGFACRAFADGDEFLQALGELEPGCVPLDMRLPRLNGLQVQAEIAKRGRALPVVAITGHADAEMAVQSMKMGAVDPWKSRLWARCCSKPSAALSPGWSRRSVGGRRKERRSPERVESIQNGLENTASCP